MNILLLSAGGSACHGVIKSLRDIDFDGKIISVDCNSLSAGFYLSLSTLSFYPFRSPSWRSTQPDIRKLQYILAFPYGSLNIYGNPAN